MFNSSAVDALELGGEIVQSMCNSTALGDLAVGEKLDSGCAVSLLCVPSDWGKGITQSMCNSTAVGALALGGKIEQSMCNSTAVSALGLGERNCAGGVQFYCCESPCTRRKN